MGLSILPTNIAGISLNGLLGPLASLFQTGSIKNLVYPSDLASNPAMGHAVQFSVYEYTTGFGDNSIAQAGFGAVTQTINTVLNSTGFKGIGNFNITNATGLFENIGTKAEQSITASSVGNAVPAAAQLFQAKTYQPVQKTPALANISLFMPETLTTNFSSTYEEVTMTEKMGFRGRLGNAYGDLLGQNPQNAGNLGANPMASVYGKDLASQAIGLLTGAGGAVTGQAAGIITNPQIQLLYKAIALRTFTLEFIMTPKDSAEAKTVKEICDTFTYYSLPGIAGAQQGTSGQYLTPPQIFSIKFKFLGQKGVLGTLSNIFNSALSNIGLGFLTNSDPTGTISSGAEAKIMTINDCVLEDVNIDYAPNGWAAYNDGYPIQTRLTLTFKETQMLTKQLFKGTAIADNYNNPFAGNADDTNLTGVATPPSEDFAGHGGLND